MIIPMDFFLVILGAILAEIGGIGMVMQSPKYANPAYFRRLGKFVCICGIVALIMSVIGLWVGAWP